MEPARIRGEHLVRTEAVDFVEVIRDRIAFGSLLADDGIGVQVILLLGRFGPDSPIDVGDLEATTSVRRTVAHVEEYADRLIRGCLTRHVATGNHDELVVDE